MVGFVAGAGGASLGLGLFGGRAIEVMNCRPPFIGCRMRDQEETPLFKSAIDYSAANQYIEAHYNQMTYFESDSVEEPIFDGRLLQARCGTVNSMLTSNGFAIVESIAPMEGNDYSDLHAIEQNYIPELERALLSRYGEELQHSVFWNPMLRGESYDIAGDSSSVATANIASLVHIDTDVGAHADVNEFLDIVQMNQVSSNRGGSSWVDDFEQTRKAIQEGRRFAVVNFWRNLSSGGRAPLAIMGTRYQSGGGDIAFPDSRPDTSRSHWYIFPNSTDQEVIVFYQYDRDSRQPSDLWHCAIQSPCDENSEPRRSFDIRALVVLNEVVKNGYDRFREDRTRPGLSFEESGCFCDEQAEERKNRNM